MTEADGTLPATRQPDKKPSAAGAGARDSLGGEHPAPLQSSPFPGLGLIYHGRTAAPPS